MLESIGSLVRVLLAALGLVAVPEPSAVALAVAAVAAVAVLALAAAILELPASAGRSAPHPRRAIDVGALLGQSHPDAAGHARPRAPGFAASAA